MSGVRSLHGLLFSDPEVDRQLGDAAQIERLLEFEVALAESQSALGLVPSRCVAAISQAARAHYDPEALGREVAQAGNLAIPLVAALTRHTAALDPEAARFVHFGATSQDALDTALLLRLRPAVARISALLERAESAAAQHARRYTAAPMAARTLLLHATPTTFGLKSAGWLDALGRARRRLEASLEAASVLQLGGAAGTLAALGSRGPEVVAALAERLGLGVPDLPWHAHRDRLCELACAFGLAVGTLGKIGRDLALLTQTEVREAFEAPRAGRGGSSTLPHKHNPVSASVALAASLRAPALVSTLLGAMPQEHERGVGGWQAEWEALPELVSLTAGSARAIAEALESLVVDVEAMRRNLGLTRGLLLAESVRVALTPHMGREEAHGCVARACEEVTRKGRDLEDVLREDPEVTRWLDDAELRRCLAPEAYLGASSPLVERVLAAFERRRNERDG